MSKKSDPTPKRPAPNKPETRYTPGSTKSGGQYRVERDQGPSKKLDKPSGKPPGKSPGKPSGKPKSGKPPKR